MSWDWKSGRLILRRRGRSLADKLGPSQERDAGEDQLLVAGHPDGVCHGRIVEGQAALAKEILTGRPFSRCSFYGRTILVVHVRKPATV
jgi:hypothetical protein